MSESRVKKIRKEVYGDYSIRARTYTRKKSDRGLMEGQIMADPKRQLYQMMKGRRKNVKIK